MSGYPISFFFDVLNNADRKGKDEREPNKVILDEVIVVGAGRLTRRKPDKVWNSDESNLLVVDGGSPGIDALPVLQTTERTDRMDMRINEYIYIYVLKPE